MEARASCDISWLLWVCESHAVETWQKAERRMWSFGALRLRTSVTCQQTKQMGSCSTTVKLQAPLHRPSLQQTVSRARAFRADNFRCKAASRNCARLSRSAAKILDILLHCCQLYKFLEQGPSPPAKPTKYCAARLREQQVSERVQKQYIDAVVRSAACHRHVPARVPFSGFRVAMKKLLGAVCTST